MDCPLLSKGGNGKWENKVSGESLGEELTEDM